MTAFGAALELRESIRLLFGVSNDNTAGEAGPGISSRLGSVIIRVHVQDDRMTDHFIRRKTIGEECHTCDAVVRE